MAEASPEQDPVLVIADWCDKQAAKMLPYVGQYHPRVGEPELVELVQRLVAVGLGDQASDVALDDHVMVTDAIAELSRWSKRLRKIRKGEIELPSGFSPEYE